MVSGINHLPLNFFSASATILRRYATRIELIKFDGEIGKSNIRFAYWRRSKGKDGKYRWNWASQTTWVFPVEITRQALEDAKKDGLI